MLDTSIDFKSNANEVSLTPPAGRKVQVRSKFCAFVKAEFNGGITEQVKPQLKI